MRLTTADRRLRAGAVTLAAGGVVLAAHVALHPPSPAPSRDLATFAAVHSGTQSLVSLGLAIPGTVLLLVGAVALYGFLARTRAERPALGGLLATFAGLSVALTALGAFVLALRPALERLAAGEEAMRPLVLEAFDVVIVFFVAGSALFVVGTALFAVAAWRSRVLPRASAVPYALAVLVINAAEEGAWPVRLAAAIFLVASVAWLSRELWRGVPEQGSRVSAGPAGEQAETAELAVGAEAGMRA